jgi:RNA polymerase sigma-70 factor (ECF subfamily)
MSTAIRDEGQLEHFRSYLYVVARLRLQGTPHRIDPSAMVQQALHEATQQHDRFHGSTQCDLATWLRRILAQHLGNAFRALHRDDEEPSRQGEAAASATPDPAEQEAMAVAQALLQLPEAQREAVVLQYWHGLTLAEIGARLNRTPVGVAGLLKGGLSRLRELLEFSG